MRLWDNITLDFRFRHGMQALEIHFRFVTGSGAGGNDSGFGDSGVSVFGRIFRGFSMA